MSHYTLVRVVVQHTGDITWVPGGSFVSKCHIDIRAYPFDVQECPIIFGNWAYDNNQVKVSFDPKAGHSPLAESGNGEWEIVRSVLLRRRESSSWCPDEKLVFLHFVYLLRRKPLYYVTYVIIPPAVLSMLVLLVLRLPPESGEKISMGVTLLLSFDIYMLLVSESLPVTSDHVPILGDTFKLLYLSHLFSFINIISNFCQSSWFCVF